MGYEATNLATSIASWNYNRTILSVASLSRDRSPGTMNLHSICYQPVNLLTTKDVFVLKDGASTGPDIYYCSSLTGYKTKYFYGQKVAPYFDSSDSRIQVSLASLSKVVFVFHNRVR